MAQYYSSLFQSGLAVKQPAPPPSIPVPMPVPGPSRHQPNLSTATSTTTMTADGSMRFVFGDNGSLRAPSRSSTRPLPPSAQRGHTSFLSMDANDKRSMHSAAPSHADLPPLAIQLGAQQRAPGAPMSPPSPALSTHSTQSHLLRSPPSPVPSTRSLKPSTSIRRANVTSEMPHGANTMRSLSNASSMYRRTNRTRALDALEGRPQQNAKYGLRPVPESRSFVPFGDSDDEDAINESQEDQEDFRRFVERTRAIAIKEKEERDRARRYAEEQERRERGGGGAYRTGSTAAQPGTTPSYLPSPPPSASAYSQNFIDLDDDSSSTRTRSTFSRSFAGLSISSGQSSKRTHAPPVASSPGPSRIAHSPVPAPPRPGWQKPAMHIASAA
ncbi:hypothetical protein BKA62DRAFT_625628 [Auriculariales sp. MPI-PUGE-AT-0066]|nr:hypothetical protein BKA62DRAFT_625628 [Auriculariales sp. MPI-PUGE-AT-0066]